MLEEQGAAWFEGAAHRTSAAKPSQLTPALLQVLQTGLFLSHLTWRRRHVAQLPRERFGRGCVSLAIPTGESSAFSDPAGERVRPSQKGSGAGEARRQNRLDAEKGLKAACGSMRSRQIPPSEASNEMGTKAMGRRGWVDEKGTAIYSLDLLYEAATRAKTRIADPRSIYVYLCGVDRKDIPEITIIHAKSTCQIINTGEDPAYISVGFRHGHNDRMSTQRANQVTGISALTIIPWLLSSLHFLHFCGTACYCCYVAGYS